MYAMPKSSMMPKAPMPSMRPSMTGMAKPSYAPTGKTFTSGKPVAKSSQWTQDQMYPSSGLGKVDDNDYSGDGGTVIK